MNGEVQAYYNGDYLNINGEPKEAIEIANFANQSIPKQTENKSKSKEKDLVEKSVYDKDFSSSINKDNTCKYCGKHFSHKGSFGRHLDLKKGDSLHPLEQINVIRSTVARRGERNNKRHKKVPNSNITIKEKSKIMASSNIVSENIKEKNKIRRKLRDRHIKSKLMTSQWFIEQFVGKESVTEKSSFARYVSLYLPVKLWPIIPDSSSYDLVMSCMETRNLDKHKLETSFEEWKSLETTRREQIWKTESYNAISATIGNICLVDLHNVKEYIARKEKETFQDICTQDNLDGYLNHGFDKVQVDEPKNVDEFNTFLQNI